MGNSGLAGEADAVEVQQGDANTPVLDEGGTIPITQTAQELPSTTAKNTNG